MARKLSSRGYLEPNITTKSRQGEIWRALERDIISWPGVSKNEMIGCLCYFYGKKFDVS